MKITLEHERFVTLMQLKAQGFGDAVAKAVKECCDIVLAEAVERCPKVSDESSSADLIKAGDVIGHIPKSPRVSEDDAGDDGRALAQSLSAQYLRTGRVAAKGSVGSPLMRAIYVHEGTGQYARKGNGRAARPWIYKDLQNRLHVTSGMEATPFLEDAMKATHEECKQHFRDAIEEALGQ